MPTTSARLVIVGGGVLGAATADALARAGVTGVVLVEAAEPASGSSGKPLGGVRAVFSDPTNVELGLRSLTAFRRLEAGPGTGIGLQEVGYLFALRSEDDVERHRPSLDVHRALGVRSELVDPAAARRRCPYLEERALVAALWSPDGGYARPTDVVRSLLRAATARGVEVRTATRAVAIDPYGPDRARVALSSGDALLAETVICCAGAWSREVGAMAGVDLPVTPKRRQIAFASTPPHWPAPPRIPFTIDYATTAYVHADERGGLLLGWADPDEPDGFARTPTTSWHAGLRAALQAFAPDLADLPLRDGWAGLYEITPDCNALVGATDAPGFRFLYACGFSGHGFLQAPAVGECVRDLHLGRRPPVDVAAFSAARFTRPAVRTEIGII